jgi:tripartite-type tricarboxylate transporter receptor subunit TctC
MKRQPLFALWLIWILAGSAYAQGDRPVRMVLPNATGSGIDVFARTLQNALAKQLNANIVIENQPGAGGIVGLQTLARATPDGHTISMVSNNIVVLPAVYKSLPFSVPGDFSVIALCGFTPFVLVTHPKVPAANAVEFNALLKAKPGELNFASSGAGTILHLISEMYLDAVGARARHIPYKGVGPMLADLLGGHVQFATTALPTVQGHIKSGALRVIGIGTAQRVPAAPDIPTLVEQGVANYVVEGWFGIMGPKGLPPKQVQRLRDAVAFAFDAPEVKDAMQRQGNVIRVTQPEEALRFVRNELVKYAALVKKVGVELQ